MIIPFIILIILFANTYSSDAFRLGNIECDVDPEPAPMSTLRCDGEKCEVTCMENYKFPNGETKLDLQCINGRRWIARNYNEVPHCIPICSPACLNGGQCIAPNQCLCRESFSGFRCQNRIISCTDRVPMPENTMGRCITSGVQSCKVTCVQGHKFPDGTLTADLKCRNGQWSMEPRRFDRCEPYCNPSCLHGGTCVAPNLCQCPTEYRGNYCQYETERCSARKLGFNGLYKCTGTTEKMECTISCPQGFNPDFPPAQKYTCRYDEGFFTPQQVPKCDYRGANVQIVHGN